MSPPLSDATRELRRRRRAEREAALEKRPPRHECPPYCHPCPHMRGDIMPQCMGSAIRADDGMDLTVCTCNPADPILERYRLGERAAMAISQLRDARRFRQVQKATVAAIRELAAAFMSRATEFVNPRDREAWQRLDSLVTNLEKELRQPRAAELDAIEAEVAVEARRTVLPFKARGKA